MLSNNTRVTHFLFQFKPRFPVFQFQKHFFTYDDPNKKQLKAFQDLLNAQNETHNQRIESLDKTMEGIKSELQKSKEDAKQDLKDEIYKNYTDVQKNNEQYETINFRPNTNRYGKSKS